MMNDEEKHDYLAKSTENAQTVVEKISTTAVLSEEAAKIAKKEAERVTRQQQKLLKQKELRSEYKVDTEKKKMPHFDAKPGCIKMRHSFSAQFK